MQKIEIDFENLKRASDAEKQQLKDARSSELGMLQSQLNEERITRMEKDMQLNEVKHALEDTQRKRDEAKRAMQEAMKQMHESEEKFHGMRNKISDAKLLMNQNEKLHHELNIETDHRKELITNWRT